jgi:23S rRNA-/tRNA-specific pseudouridylate synthase
VLAVLHKPARLPVLPSELYYEHTVLQILRTMHAKAAFPATVCEVPHPAHRLGVGTSGVLICAIGADARSALSRAFE